MLLHLFVLQFTANPCSKELLSQLDRASLSLCFSDVIQQEKQSKCDHFNNSDERRFNKEKAREITWEDGEDSGLLIIFNNTSDNQGICIGLYQDCISPCGGVSLSLNAKILSDGVRLAWRQRLAPTGPGAGRTQALPLWKGIIRKWQNCQGQIWPSTMINSADRIEL